MDLAGGFGCTALRISSQSTTLPFLIAKLWPFAAAQPMPKNVPKKRAEKLAEKVAEESAETFSAYNSSVLRPSCDALGGPFQTRHTDPSPNAAPAQEFLDFG